MMRAVDRLLDEYDGRILTARACADGLLRADERVALDDRAPRSRELDLA
jgi:hypothetical protein